MTRENEYYKGVKPGLIMVWLEWSNDYVTSYIATEELDGVVRKKVIDEFRDFFFFFDWGAGLMKFKWWER